MPVLDANNKPTKNADGTPAYQQQDAQDANGNDPVTGDANGKRPRLWTKRLPSPSTTQDGAWIARIPTTTRSSTTIRRSRRSSPRTNSASFSSKACIAILCLVGFESVTSMGEEAKKSKERHPVGYILLSLTIQGAILLPVRKYFATNYLHE